MKLAISFSGGRTSGFMLALLLKKYPDADVRITFANTGCEHPATLDFIDKCDKQIAGGRVVWLEAEVDQEQGIGVRHRVVDYSTASRDGRPFRDYIAKYGIPNQTTPTCTSRLKQNVMESYLRGEGFIRGKRMNYLTAIGIRADEIDRVLSTHKEQALWYPLVDEGVTKETVKDFWRNQPFDLELDGEHYGNCVWCWKKSDRKLMTLALESPEVFDFPRRMEAEFGAHKADSVAAHNGRRYFFRRHRSVDDIFAAAAKPFTKYRDTNQYALFSDYDPDLDVGSGCSESCEVGADYSMGGYE